MRSPLGVAEELSDSYIMAPTLLLACVADVDDDPDEEDGATTPDRGAD